MIPYSRVPVSIPAFPISNRQKNPVQGINQDGILHYSLKFMAYRSPYPILFLTRHPFHHLKGIHDTYRLVH